jgi:hypothetical protein
VRKSLFRHALVMNCVVVLAMVAAGQISLTVRAPKISSAAAADVATQPRSTHCHATDGVFGTCPDGSSEWSDITPAQAPGTNAWVYADQGMFAPGRTTPDTFFLSYDECGRTTPLGANEYFLVSFDSVETEDGHDALVRYNVHVFPDGTIIVFEDGTPLLDADGHSRTVTVDNQRGKATFGSSPQCSAPHLVVEYQIDLTQAGGNSYSPDPIFWGGTPPQCTVKIENRAPSGDTDTAEELADEARGTMNVAEHAAFNAVVTGGPGGTPSFQWAIDGTTIKDYTDNSASAGFSSLGAPDLTQSSVDFYWGQETGARNVAVTVTVGTGADQQTCQDSRAITVERSTTATRLAEHWWMTNHNTRVSFEHSGWHTRNMEFGLPVCAAGALPASPPTCYGRTFFDFHRGFIGAFNDFRAFFGYAATGPAYDPSTPIPTGPGIDHAGRASSAPDCGSTCAIPTEFTTTGTTPHVRSGDCDPTLTPEPRRIQDWPADQNALACAVTAPWHNNVHVSIGGDMAATRTAPLDPIFWRWHMYVGSISTLRSGFTPAQHSQITPNYTYQWITSLPTVTVTYDKSVSGVVAADLTINGQPATSVTGSGAGPYVFSGYPAPALGHVAVALSAGTIIAANGDPAIPETWSYELVNPNLTVPGDTMTVGQRLVLSLDPTRADSGGDGLPDSFKLAHPCTVDLAYTDTDAPMMMDGTTGPQILDARGGSLHEDYALGTDPCLPNGSVGTGSIRSGLATATLPGNDDGSTGAVPLPFSPNFFGTTYSQLFVNNNGNVTFDAALSAFTPFDLTSTQRVIIAPFFADVDTRGGNVLTYGNGTVDGHQAFAVTWPGVRCFAAGTNQSLNNFQVVLIDRADTGAGNFDIEFNYDGVQWETGTASGGNVSCLGGSSARAGFSQGTGAAGTFFELPGSGVPGSFLDASPTGLDNNQHNSPQLGRYLYPVRNGAASTVDDADADGVADALDNCPHAANPGQQDAELNGIGDACQAAVGVHSTAAFLQANLDGTTSSQPVDPAIAHEPDIVGRLQRIIDFRIASGLATDRAKETADIFGSAAALGLLTAPTVDKVVSADAKVASNRITAPPLTTTVGNELVLALVSTDGPGTANQAVSALSGGGLTWTRAGRANAAFGTAEVWRAYAIGPLNAAVVTATLAKGGYDGAITVATFTGASPVLGATAIAAANSGAPGTTLTTTRAQSLVWTVGHDWTHAAAVTPPSDQRLVHLFRDTRVQDTSWVQATNTPASAAGTAVHAGVTGPTADHWNITSVEVLPAVAPVSGLGVDTIRSTHQPLGASTLASPPVSTTAANGMLLALVSADGPAGTAQKVTRVTGAGLTWTLASRANARGGTAEVWRAFATGTVASEVVTAQLAATGYDGTITVVAFGGASASLGTTSSAGGASGPPRTTLTTSVAGSQVWAAGQDWDHAVVLSPMAGQTVVNQFADTRIGGTYWAQRFTAAQAGTAVTLGGTAPTTGRWNLAAVEVLPRP